MREGLGGHLAAVSLNPNIDLSVHDRVFFALGAGTVPVFDTNRFSTAEMPHRTRYGFGQDTTSIAAAVEAVLADPAAAQAATATTMSELYPRFSMQRSLQDIHEITMSIAGAAGAGLLPAEPVPAGVWTPKQAA
ncbi:hypothetical protein [Bradyrhizobium tropiciagri]|uniref:hypothetical protein n=1 Tax=Bradyrhizobium tropiciagri TaxID=312253 RepID=UPI001FCDC9CE|nr:hypothetical protein [Bradyrhizobium tropiciagri]